MKTPAPFYVLSALTFLLFLGTASILHAQNASPPPTVQTNVAYVTESRALIFATDKGPYLQSIAKHLGLTVCLNINSRLLRHPDFYHHVRIITEVLNTGHTLTPIAPRFRQIIQVRGHLYQNMQQAGAVGFPVILRFAAPSPKAATIRELIGSLDVAAGGTFRTITLNNPATLVNKHISNAGLQAAHVRMRIMQIIKSRHSRFMILEIMAPAGVFKSVSVQQNHKIISGGYIIAQLPKGIDKLMIPLTSAPGPSAQLHMTLLTGWHEYRIPFTLNNIPLPDAPPIAHHP